MSYYTDKDKKKFAVCDKLISRGAVGSSSWRYSQEGIGHIKPEMVYCGHYTRNDVVGISVNGARKDRVSFDPSEVKKALEADSIVVIDNDYHANRHFNIGERELRQFLLDNDYVKVVNDQWRSVWLSRSRAKAYFERKKKEKERR